jgi:hypothetical protein
MYYYFESHTVINQRGACVLRSSVALFSVLACCFGFDLVIITPVLLLAAADSRS